MSPPISVVIPLYNKEKSVGRCVASVLNQTYPAAEIIIVNDGSTDASLSAVQKIRDPRLKIFDQKNGGVSSARNFGIAQAQHELVALLDADDEWHPAFLEKMISAAGKFPAAGLYYAPHTNLNGEKITTTVIPTLPPDFCGPVNIFDHNTDAGPWSSAVVLRKSFLAQTGLFDTRLVKGEDIDLWIRFALNGPVIFCNVPLSTCHGDAENRAMQKPSPPELSLVNNLARYDLAAKKNPEFHEYLLQMRVAHICNFLGGGLCELADAHAEMDRLDVAGLPWVWTWIRRSPRRWRRVIFKLYAYSTLALRLPAKLLRSGNAS
jgi:glycosyltransferase involved in cell wall biosynthesis